MVDEDTRARMQALEDRLAKRRRDENAPKPATGQGYSGAELAWRMVIELVAGLGIGFGIGGIGTASRAMVARFTPAHKTAEFFGLWGMVYKLAGVVGVASFGQVKAWIGMPVSLAMLTGFFAVGFLLMLRVDEMSGFKAARRYERNK